MRRNVALTLWSDGWIEEVNSSAVSAAGYRAELFLGLGAQQDVSEARKQARSEVRRLAAPREELQVGFRPPSPADRPYRNCFPGDRIRVQGEWWPLSSVRVRKVEGRAEFAPRLGERIPSDQDRVVMAQRKMTAGTGGGDSKVATPAALVSPASTLPPLPPAVPAPPFDHDGVLVEAVSHVLPVLGKWTFVQWASELTVAASSDTTLQVLVNDALVAWWVVPAFVTSHVHETEIRTVRGDRVQMVIAVAGVGGEGLTVTPSYRIG